MRHINTEIDNDAKNFNLFATSVFYDPVGFVTPTAIIHKNPLPRIMVLGTELE